MLRWLPGFVLVFALVLVVDFQEPHSAAAVSTTFIVTSTADTAGATCSTDCTLRQAITAANANGNPTEVDRITFNIPGAGVKTIALANELPVVSQPVSIEGDTQPLATCTGPRNLLIEIDGGGLVGIGIFLGHGDPSAAFGSTIRGLTIHGATIYQVSLGTGDGHVVECSNIGTNPAGTAAAGAQASVGIFDAASGAAPRVGGAAPAKRNIIGNGLGGVIGDSDGIVVAGNYIGVGADGVTPIPNGTGILLRGNNATIGGPTAASGNVISGNGTGIEVGGIGHTISFNIIGVAADGATAAGNTQYGVRVQSASAPEISNNLISANGDSGISMQSVAGGEVFSNVIGLSLDRASALGNATHGIEAYGSSGVNIGSGNANYISGNGLSAIYLLGVQEIVIRRNVIGYAGDNTTPIPNGSAAILVTGDSFDVQVGGVAPSLWNRIYAEADGEARASAVEAAAIGLDRPRAVAVIGNLMRSDGHAINLLPAGELPNVVTHNDGVGDNDAGPNSLQNFPVITSAVPGATPEVRGFLPTNANAYVITFYASGTCDSATARQAWRPVGTKFLTVPGGAFFTATMTGALAEGEFVTATAAATNFIPDTSELSPCKEVKEPDAAPLLLQVTPGEIPAGTLQAELQVQGENFTPTSVVTWDGGSLTTVFNSSTSLTATVTRADIGFTGWESFAVVVDAGGGLTSDALDVLIVPSSADVDCSAVVTAEDATFMLRALAGIEEGLEDCPLDVNQDANLDLRDVLRIRKEVALLIDFPFPRFPD